LKRLAAIALILLVATMAQAHSLWSDTLGTRAVVETGYTGGNITSYKAHGVPDPTDPLCRASEGNVSLELGGSRAVVVFYNISQGWIAWIGLVVSNDGTLPTRILEPSVGLASNFTHEPYIYGPFQAPGTSGAWGGVDPCEIYNETLVYGEPFPSIGSSPQVLIDPGQKAIVWILVNYTGTASLANTTIVIDVNKAGP
jgi:hypothetical protein